MNLGFGANRWTGNCLQSKLRVWKLRSSLRPQVSQNEPLSLGPLGRSRPESPGDSTHGPQTILRGLEGCSKEPWVAPSPPQDPGPGAWALGPRALQLRASDGRRAELRAQPPAARAHSPSTPTRSASPPGGLRALPGPLPLPPARRHRVCAYSLGCVTRLGRPPGSAPFQTVCKDIFYKCKTSPSSGIDFFSV